MDRKNNLIALLIATFIGLPSLALSDWFTSKVVEVSTRSDTGNLYIRTESNPNPNNCPSVWNGAQWEGSGASLNLAASIALSAKATGSDVRFFIKTDVCTPSGNPVLQWIQSQ